MSRISSGIKAANNKVREAYGGMLVSADASDSPRSLVRKRPCPCGSTSISLKRRADPIGFAYLCSCCGRTTRWYTTIAFAKGKWNIKQKGKK
jgi:hypothetical protein